MLSVIKRPRVSFFTQDCLGQNPQRLLFPALLHQRLVPGFPSHVTVTGRGKIAHSPWWGDFHSIISRSPQEPIYMPFCTADSNILPNFYGSLFSLHPHLPIGEVICSLQSPIHQITHWYGEENHLHHFPCLVSCMQQ